MRKTTRFHVVDVDYEPPVLETPGHVRRITLGSSPSGNADANSQYYW
ncbi:lasso RiPP family leader peptide-containing protein [Nocardia sp. NRRL S-836]|nr:lasso RiPP family leader peptide-containing protein [Nocardia sp. NRRL S-836]